MKPKILVYEMVRYKLTNSIEIFVQIIKVIVNAFNRI
jgi:hypothetical protein